MKKGQVLMVEQEQCTGCKICELICSMTKFGEYNPSKSHIKVLRNRELAVNIVALGTYCDFCGTCAEWCPYHVLEFMDFKQAAVIRGDKKAKRTPSPIIAS